MTKHQLRATTAQEQGWSSPRMHRTEYSKDSTERTGIRLPSHNLRTLSARSWESDSFQIPVPVQRAIPISPQSPPQPV